DDWYVYFQIYQDSIQRWREKSIYLKDGFSWDFFHQAEKIKSPSIKLWLAIYDNRIVAGALCSYSKKHVAYWHGSALKKYFSICPTNLLIHEIIKDACINGYRWFDFSPSGGLKGVEAFKNSFGTEVLKCPTVDIDTGVLKILRAIFELRKITLNSFKAKVNQTKKGA
ncbi:GNAT family N-acetyltransferase, partial [bacterium]|nr:GNAT family N-acetyltransferase [bacterium]